MRDKWLHLRLSESERASWQAAAAEAGVTLADLIRQRMGDAATTKRKPTTRQRRMAAPAADPALLAGIAKAGNNLNQLARWANTYRGTADQVQVLAALAAIERQLSSFLPPNAPAQAGAADAEGED